MMSLIRDLRPLRATLSRLMETSARVKRAATPPPTDRAIIEPLSERDLVRVEGEEIVPFLQGLITNDMAHLQTSSSMYAMFLNKAGRVLYDSIIYRTSKPTTFLIECDKRITKELCRHLRLYRVRRSIQVDNVENEFRPWVVFHPSGDVGSLRQSAADILVTPDPRVRELGLRVITTPAHSWNDLAKHFSCDGERPVSKRSDTDSYRMMRYRNGVGEGVSELPPGKCFPLEANCDFLHGVSFHKGCYIGQELTARIHHTGVIRKRLMPLRLTAAPKAPNVQSQAGAIIGSIRGTSHDRALALMRIEPVMQAQHLLIESDPCYAERPNWWPTDLPNKMKMRE